MAKIVRASDVGSEKQSSMGQSQARVLPDDERGDKENRDKTGVVGWVLSKFGQSKDKRWQHEDRWLNCYRNNRGSYGDEVKFRDNEKSRAFIKVTKTKVVAAYSQISEVLFSGNTFPIGIEPLSGKPSAEGDIAKHVHFNPEHRMLETQGINIKDIISTNRESFKGEFGEVFGEESEADLRLGSEADKLAPIYEELSEGPGLSPSSFTYSPERESASKMEKLIHSQLDESDASKHLRSMCLDLCLYGTGVLKGPFPINKEYPFWDENGTFKPIYKSIPKVEYVSLWDIYPDLSSNTMASADYIIQRHKLSAYQLRQLSNLPFSRETAIQRVIEMGGNYEEQWWESTISEDESGSEGDVNSDRFEVLEFWGYIDTTIAKRENLYIFQDSQDTNLDNGKTVQVNVLICGGYVLRLVLNPFTPSRIPYSVVPYEVNQYSMFGIGVAENMADTQTIMNGFMRLAVDNAALSSNLLIEVDETALIPGQSLDVYPGKIFRRQSGPPGQSIFATKWPNLTGECLQVFDKARQLADEATGIPSFSHGQTGVTGIGRTASGISMLMGAAAQNIKAVVRNIDDYLLAPLGYSLYHFNQQFNFDKEVRGPLEVKARGTESLMRLEVKSQRMLQLLQIVANPVLQPYFNMGAISREVSKSMDLDLSVLNDEREVARQKMLLAESIPPVDQTLQGGGGVAAGVPSVEDPTQSGGGNIGPGQAPEPTSEGFTGQEANSVQVGLGVS